MKRSQGAKLASILPVIDPLVRGLTESAAVTRFTDCITLPVAILSSKAHRDSMRFLHVNPAFVDLCGFSAADLVGESPSLLLGEESDLYAARTFVNEVKTDGCSFANMIHYRKDGSPYEAFLLGARIEAQPEPDAAVTRFASFSILLRDVELILPRPPMTDLKPTMS
ncbi:MAG: PAS domain-containing protein [Pseudomonadota bacterium]